MPKIYRRDTLRLPDLTAQYYGWPDVDWTITEHSEGVVLESVWEDLSGENREEIMDSLVPVIEAFYKVKITDHGFIQKNAPILEWTIRRSSPTRSGEGWPGHKYKAESFLHNLPRKNSGVEVDTENPGNNRKVTIKSSNPKAAISIPKAELEELEENTVFSFMDLEPRNILVPPHPDPQKTGW